MSQTENVAQATPVRITISSVLDLLAQGKNRKEIADFFGKTQTEMNILVWSHPKLKGRKAKKQYSGIELEDDTEEVVNNSSEENEVQVEENTTFTEENNTAIPTNEEEPQQDASASQELWK